ncbi:MAG TPA: glycosyltransferase family 4 protein [Puia sp.]|nr:glycosyltransferase family 4 protein [Puia sp.]
MKIVLAHHQDPDDIHAFSGTSYHMTRALREHFDVVAEYRSFEPYTLFEEVLRKGLRPVLGPIGRKFSDYLQSNNIQADFVICLGGNSSIPFYDHPTPIVFWHDSTWHTFLQSYQAPEYFREFRTAAKNLYLWDKAVLEKAHLLAYSSQFIADACIKDYKTPGKKINVIPFGANLQHPPSPAVLKEALERRLASPSIQLTFLGKDWKRKGLDLAYMLTKDLNQQGIPIWLNTIGCVPDFPELYDSPFVTNFGLLDKSVKEDMSTLEHVFRDTHFLVHPASAEPFGIALCEANAYGIPVIGTAVEGLGTIVRDGVNGFLYDRNTWLAAAQELLKRLAADLDNTYPPLFNGSLEAYRSRLNWQTNVLRLKDFLADYKNA